MTPREEHLMAEIIYRTKMLTLTVKTMENMESTISKRVCLSKFTFYGLVSMIVLGMAELYLGSPWWLTALASMPMFLMGHIEAVRDSRDWSKRRDDIKAATDKAWMEYRVSCQDAHDRESEKVVVH